MEISLLRPNLEVLQKAKSKKDPLVHKVDPSVTFSQKPDDGQALVFARARALPETRADKIKDAKEKIQQGYYSTAGLVLSLVDRLLQNDYAGCNNS